VGIPYGGAKGGVNCPGDRLTPQELQAVTRSLLDKIEKVLGPTRDIMAPDVNTSAQVMAWLMDEYGKLNGHTPAIVTGKPLALEGSYGRESATGRGLVYMFREAAPKLGLTPTSTTAVIQGFGNVGSWAARILHQLGVRIVGISNADGAIRSDEGIDTGKLSEFIVAGGKLTEFEGVDAISPEDLLSIPCDVLVPAALGGMIHEGNVDSIQCRMVLEGANSPTTPGADEVLNEKGIYVVPDVMANAGGVVVSYFEWVQNLQHFRWEEREVNDKLGNIMRRAFREVDAAAKQRSLSLREASYQVGIERVVETARLRGYI
jgi:glutamate dehydrogenase (NAD(P)+)